jgi:hypothetical protein
MEFVEGSMDEGVMIGESLQQKREERHRVVASDKILG